VSRKTSSYIALDRMSAINKRIYGDSGTNGTPTYGLQRWQMTGLTGWSASMLRALGQDVSSDEDHVAVTTTFELKALTQTW
jgi:phenylacetate-coenzyme A ligase PaaK-like adenylate-forming protein